MCRAVLCCCWWWMLPDQMLGLCLVPILPWTESLYVLSDEYGDMTETGTRIEGLLVIQLKGRYLILHCL